MVDRDADDLRRFGYEPALARRLGAFSSFAVAFSLISVFTGVFANFGHGLRQVGGAVVWSWLIVLGGQMLVALLLAELSTRMPLSGYGYQWTSRLVNPHVGFFVGWLLTLQFLTGFPGVCATFAAQSASWLGGAWTDPPVVVALTLAVIAAVAIVHLLGIRAASLVNDTGVWTELIGVVTLSGLLIGVALWRGADAHVLMTAASATGAPAGIENWALSLLLGAWCLTGFEAAADLAEETHQPRRVVPRGIVTSLATAGAAGFFLLAGAVLALPDLDAARTSASPLTDLLEHAFGHRGRALVLVVVGVSIFACALASMAGASRLLFAMARDRMLPGSQVLAFVSPGHRAPRNCIIFIWAVSSLVVLLLPTLDVITQISAVAGYLGYAGIVVAALRAPAMAGPQAFTLGRLRPWIGGLALVWTLAVVLALTVPPMPLPGIATVHLPAISTAIGIAIGVVIYAGLIRGRLQRGDGGPPRAT